MSELRGVPYVFWRVCIFINQEKNNRNATGWRRTPPGATHAVRQCGVNKKNGRTSRVSNLKNKCPWYPLLMSKRETKATNHNHNHKYKQTSCSSVPLLYVNRRDGLPKFTNRCGTRWRNACHSLRNALHSQRDAFDSLKPRRGSPIPLQGKVFAARRSRTGNNSTQDAHTITVCEHPWGQLQS